MSVGKVIIFSRRGAVNVANVSIMTANHECHLLSPESTFPSEWLLTNVQMQRAWTITLMTLPFSTRLLKAFGQLRTHNSKNASLKAIHAAKIRDLYWVSNVKNVSSVPQVEHKRSASGDRRPRS